MMDSAQQDANDCRLVITGYMFRKGAVEGKLYNQGLVLLGPQHLQDQLGKMSILFFLAHSVTSADYHTSQL
jgi:hypothetical protein